MMSNAIYLYTISICAIWFLRALISVIQVNIGLWPVNQHLNVETADVWQIVMKNYVSQQNIDVCLQRLIGEIPDKPSWIFGHEKGIQYSRCRG
jgi:hypothetical protein